MKGQIPFPEIIAGLRMILTRLIAKGPLLIMIGLLVLFLVIDAVLGLKLVSKFCMYTQKIPLDFIKTEAAKVCSKIPI